MQGACDEYWIFKQVGLMLLNGETFIEVKSINVYSIHLPGYVVMMQ